MTTDALEVELTPGSVVAGYQVLCLVARGGMGTVWLARCCDDPARLVAMKTVLPRHDGDPRVRAMFMDEGRIASRIQHPNVAATLSFGEHGETLYLVMEWIHGASLSVIRRGLAKSGKPMHVGAAVRIIADACAGLHAAHELRDERGNKLEVIHRDVSPDNILVACSGDAKLIDFGIARARERMAESTRQGSIKGKARYVAPERLGSRVFDRRADVWAAGATLYYLLAGVPPYDGPTDAAVLAAIRKGDRPRPLPDCVPTEVASAVLRALHRSPTSRFQSADELRTALVDALRKSHPTTTADVAALIAPVLSDVLADLRVRIATALRGLPSPDSSGEVNVVGLEVETETIRDLQPPECESDEPRTASGMSRVVRFFQDFWNKNAS